jgi:uncharacterized protein YabE (DUF348 family)
MERTAITSPNSFQLPRGLVAITTLLVITAAILTGYEATLARVTLVIDGQPHYLRTHQDTVGALLMDLGLIMHPEDTVTPGDLSMPLESVRKVVVERARPVTLYTDGHSSTFRTLTQSVESFLREVQVSVGPHDELEVEGEFLPTGRSPGHSLRHIIAAEPEPVRITIRRAVPFVLHEDGQATQFYTTAETVGEALRGIGLTLYLADGVEPGLGEFIAPDLHVHIDRSVPVQVEVDRRIIRTRTHRERADEVLADLDIVLTGQDYATPALDTPLEEGATIRVVRVTERFLIEQEPIPYESLVQPDPDLEIDHQRLLQEGKRGILERRIRLRYEDGNEVARQVENVYVAVPPTPKITGYGTMVVVRTLDTPSGPVEYWRTIRMLATSYSAATAGTSPSSPWYGRTRTGERMRFGIVAVDPRYIQLRTNVYVPGYGVGYAGDTGGAIKGRRIDLGYDDDNLILWYRFVDVYLLTPVPDRITYVLGP